MTRVPAMHALPWQILGLTLIRPRQSSMHSLYGVLGASAQAASALFDQAALIRVELKCESCLPIGNLRRYES